MQISLRFILLLAFYPLSSGATNSRDGDSDENQGTSFEEFVAGMEELAERLADFQDKIEEIVEAVKLDNGPDTRIADLANDQAISEGIVRYLKANYRLELLWNWKAGEDSWTFGERFFRVLNHALISDCSAAKQEFSPLYPSDRDFSEMRDQLSPRVKSWLDFVDICRSAIEPHIFKTYLSGLASLDEIMAQLDSAEETSFPEKTHNMIYMALWMTTESNREQFERLENWYFFGYPMPNNCSLNRLKQVSATIRDEHERPTIRAYLRYHGQSQAEMCVLQLRGSWQATGKEPMRDREHQFAPLRSAIEQARPSPSDSSLIDSLDDQLMASGLAAYLRSQGVEPEAGAIESSLQRLLGPLCEGVPRESLLTFIEVVQLLRPEASTTLTIRLGSPAEHGIDWLTNLLVCAHYESQQIDYGSLARALSSGSASLDKQQEA